jgi:fructose-1-phosphate kinase PfkB-like protein
MVFNQFLEGEVNRCSTYRLDASGKGVNVARIIAQAGGHAIHLTHAGGPRRQELLDMLDADGFETIYADSKSQIRTCTTIINTENSTTTELVEEPEPVSPDTDALVRKLFTDALTEVSTVVISGTRTPGYSENLYPSFVQEAKKAGKRVVLDVKGTDLEESLAFKVDVIKPNLSEFAATFLPGVRVLEQEDSSEIQEIVVTKLKELHALYGTAILLTRGAHPVWIYDDSGFKELPVQQVQPVNTIGCGDAVTAGIALELDRGEDFTKAVATGLSFGRINAERLRPGTIL